MRDPTGTEVQHVHIVVGTDSPVGHFYPVKGREGRNGAIVNVFDKAWYIIEPAVIRFIESP